jgi:hypothetical protein
MSGIGFLVAVGSVFDGVAANTVTETFGDGFLDKFIEIVSCYCSFGDLDEDWVRIRFGFGHGVSSDFYPS